MSQKFQLVRYQKRKKKFEIMTKQGAVTKFKEGKLGFNNVCSTTTIFTNSKKGEQAKESDLMDVFETTNEEEVCKLILKMGTLQLTAKEREAKVQQKRQQILHHIHSNWEDPKSKLPHPMLRLENAFKASKCKVDVEGDAMKQAEDAVKKMQGDLLFARISQIQGTLTLEMKYIGVVEGMIRRFATVNKTDYEGSNVVYQFECSRGNLEKFQGALFKPTDGNYKLILSGMDEALTKEITGKKNKHKKEKKKKKKVKK